MQIVTAHFSVLVGIQRMGGWMTGYFTSFTTIFQSYLDTGRVIVKGCLQWNPVYERKEFCLQESNSEPLDQQASTEFIELREKLLHT